MVNPEKRFSIYIVEDEIILAKGIRRYFTRQGFSDENITTLLTFAQATDMLKKVEPTLKEKGEDTLWFIDMVLPGGSGFHLLDSMTKINNYGQLKVVIITADQSIVPANLERQYPFCRVILKPFGIRVLDTIINDIRGNN